MSNPLATTVDVIEHLGGNAKVAAMLATTDKAVANWRYSGLFPANTYLALRQALGKKADVADSLWAMRPLIKVRKRRRR